MKIFILVIISSLSLMAIQNTSMSKLVLQFQGDEFNMLIAPPNLVGVTKRQKKTRKAILQGYSRELKNIKRLIIKNEMQINMKIPSPRVSLIPQYKKIDKQAYLELNKMVVSLTDVQNNILNALVHELKESEKDLTDEEDILSGDDLDIDLDSMFDTTGDTVSVNNQQVSPEGIFEPSFLDVGEMYNNGNLISAVNAVQLPFLLPDRSFSKKSVHATYAMAFFPTKVKGMKVMRLFIHFIIINTETQSATVSVKEVPNFRWDRNYLYISGATSKVMRKILSEVFGKAI